MSSDQSEPLFGGGEGGGEGMKPLLIYSVVFSFTYFFKIKIKKHFISPNETVCHV